MDETDISANTARKRLSLPEIPMLEREKRGLAEAGARIAGRLDGVGRSRSITLKPLIWLSEVEPVLAQAYIVRDLIAAGAAVVIYGDSNSGKTFFVLDLALHIAAGRPWRDQRIQPGLVVYVAAEGGHGIRNRLAAYRQAASWTKGASFAVLPQNVDLLDPLADTGPLIEVIQAAEEIAGQKVAAIVLDTLARVMTGGNENDSRDMSAFIANVDRVRAETGAAVLIIHHAGKDATKGARGHSSLRAAVDTEILVEGLEGTRTATVCKQRDMPSGQVYAFTLEPVTVGTDAEDGTAITSCVVAVTDAPAKQRRVSGKNQEALLAGLREWQREHNSADLISSIDLTAVAKVQGLKARNRKQEAIDGLIRHEYLQPAVGGYRLAL
jgi:hypothetical protein